MHAAFVFGGHDRARGERLERGQRHAAVILHRGVEQRLGQRVVIHALLRLLADNRHDLHGLGYAPAAVSPLSMTQSVPSGPRSRRPSPPRASAWARVRVQHLRGVITGFRASSPCESSSSAPRGHVEDLHPEVAARDHDGPTPRGSRRSCTDLVVLHLGDDLDGAPRVVQDLRIAHVRGFPHEAAMKSTSLRSRTRRCRADPSP